MAMVCIPGPTRCVGIAVSRDGDHAPTPQSPQAAQRSRKFHEVVALGPRQGGSEPSLAALNAEKQRPTGRHGIAEGGAVDHHRLRVCARHSIAAFCCPRRAENGQRVCPPLWAAASPYPAGGSSREDLYERTSNFRSKNLTGQHEDPRLRRVCEPHQERGVE